MLMPSCGAWALTSVVADSIHGRIDSPVILNNASDYRANGRLLMFGLGDGSDIAR